MAGRRLSCPLSQSRCDSEECGERQAEVSEEGLKVSDL